MTRKRSRKINCDGSLSVWERFLCAFLLIIWVFPFFNASAASKFDIHEPDSRSPHEDHIGLYSDKVDASTPYPFHSHFPDPHVEGSYELDEEESESHADDDAKAILTAFAGRHSFLGKVRSATIIPPTPHRNSVALFILFHSWKSHLF